jgi:hypothetical protein
MTTADIAFRVLGNREAFAEWNLPVYHELIYFSDRGNGDYYAFHVVDGRDKGVVHFCHETGTTELKAPTLYEFLEQQYKIHRAEQEAEDAEWNDENED